VQEQQRGSQNLQRQFAKIESEDVHLWSISILIGLAVAAGFAALNVPNIVWHHSILIQANARYLPHLLFVFIALILIFNFYTFDQRRKLKWTREELLRQLARGDVAEGLSLIDPLTETYNRRYMEAALVKEASRTNRTGAALSLVMIDADGFKRVNTRFGHHKGDLVLVEISKLLNSTFRGSDTIVRYGGDEFLIILPDTDEQQGQLAIGRLAKAVDAWNTAGSVPHYHMSLSCGVACYRSGMNIEQVVETADQNMYANKSPKASHAR